MEFIFLFFHGFWRYLVLALLIIAVYRGIRGILFKQGYSPADDRIYLFTMIAAHIQLLSGFALYLISTGIHHALSDFGAAMKNSELRYLAVEHPAMMIIAITLITIGRIYSKKAAEPVTKHKRAAWFMLIALVIILYAIPWPFSEISRPFLR